MNQEFSFKEDLEAKILKEYGKEMKGRRFSGIRLSDDPRRPVVVFRDQETQKEKEDEEDLLSLSEFFEKLLKRREIEQNDKRGSGTRFAELIKHIEGLFEKFEREILEKVKEQKQKCIEKFQEEVGVSAQKEKRDFASRFLEAMKKPKEVSGFKEHFEETCHLLAATEPPFGSDKEPTSFEKKQRALEHSFSRISSKILSLIDRLTPIPVSDFLRKARLGSQILEASPTREAIGFSGRGLSLHPFNSSFLMAFDDGTIEARDYKKQSQLVFKTKIDLGGSGQGYHSVVWCPTGEHFVISSMNTRNIHFLDAKGKVVSTLGSNIISRLWRVCWISEDLLMAGYSNGEMQLFLLTATIQRELGRMTQFYLNGIESMLWLRNRKELLVGDTVGRLYATSFIIVEGATLKFEKKWFLDEMHNGRVKMLSANLDQTKVVSCSDDCSVSLMSTNVLEVEICVKMEGPITSVFFSPCQRYILTHQSDPTKLYIMSLKGNILHHYHEPGRFFQSFLPITREVEECQREDSYQNDIITLKTKASEEIYQLVQFSLVTN